MGQINFNDWKNANNNNSTQNTKYSKNYLPYFTLKNDKDSAIVRFLYNKTEDFDIVNVHRVNVNKKLRLVNCLRDAKEPIDNCPLCKMGKKLETKFFIPLVEYTSEGPVVKMWERSASFINTINNYITEYAPLSEYIFKITRNGESGSKSTTYDIMPCNPRVYNSDNYPIPKDVKIDKAVGTIVFNFKAEDIYDMMDAEGNIDTSKRKKSNPSQETKEENKSLPWEETPKTSTPMTDRYSSINNSENPFNRPQRFS